MSTGSQSPKAVMREQYTNRQTEKVSGMNCHSRSCCQCRQAASSPGSHSVIIAAFAIGFGFLCVVLAAWNARLYNELTRVRRDVDILLRQATFPVSRQKFQELEEPVANEYNDVELQNKLLPDNDWIEQLHDKAPSNPHRLNNLNRLFGAGEDQSHNLVKRSADAAAPVQPSAIAPQEKGVAKRKVRSRSRGKGRGRRPSGSRRKCRQCNKRGRVEYNKAMAIHVQAQDLSASGIVPKYGNKIIGWIQPSLPEATKYFDISRLTTAGLVNVRASGYYYVYGQVVFEVSTLPFMVAEVGVKTLGANTLSKCIFSRPLNATQSRSYVTCTSGGVVRLSAGEGISLSVSPSNVRVYMKPECTYFGTFFIGL